MNQKTYTIEELAALIDKQTVWDKDITNFNA